MFYLSGIVFLLNLMQFIFGYFFRKCSMRHLLSNIKKYIFNYSMVAPDGIFSLKV